MKRTIIVGDVHGCLVELDELLEKLELRDGDRLVFLGDLFDRGPDPLGVVRRVRELGAEMVLGNHDEKHVRRRKHTVRRRADPAYKMPAGFPEERHVVNEAITDDEALWLASLPVALDVGSGFIAVHGGLEPGLPLGKQKDEHVLRCRWVDARGLYVPLRGDDMTAQPEGTVYWAEAWDGPVSVVYGHAVHSLSEPRIDRSPSGFECYGIDTGCCFGGALTALLLEDRTFVQVQARARYAKSPGLHEAEAKRMSEHFKRNSPFDPDAAAAAEKRACELLGS